MKIGLSFSRCLLDIIEDRIDEEEVLVIIARTDFNPHEDDQWKGIWQGYVSGDWNINAEWRNHTDGEQKFRELSIRLYDTGKLHQPRQYGAHPPRRSEYWLEAVLPPSELERNPSVKKAWDNFQVVAGLTNIKLDKEYR